MSFDSWVYIVFLAAAVLLYRLFPRRLRWTVLLAGSYVFYAWWNVKLTALILLVTALSYTSGLLIETAPTQKQKRVWLTGCAAISFGLLGIFKYANMLIATVNTALSALGQELAALDILLPVGISFYTFQAVSYVIDVYRGKLRAERHPGYYALYLAFFPQLVAGPIERAGALLPQLRAGREPDREDLMAGMRLLLTGYFRKLVAADLAAPFVNAVFGAQAPDGSAAALGAVLFAIQIYCDFSGYSEIAMGSARLLGIRLMSNFRRPYGAADIREFWHRWHISLTVWFTDYVYIPLGGSRKGTARQLVNTLAVFALCGLWHGAGWHFLFWGALHGLFLSVCILHRRSGRQLPKPVSRALTLGAVCFAWIFFRADSLTHARQLVRCLFSAWDVSRGLELLMTAARRGTSPIVLLLLLLTVPAVIARLPEPEERIKPETAALMLLMLLAAVLIRMDSGMANTFIYFQF